MKYFPALMLAMIMPLVACGQTSEISSDIATPVDYQTQVRHVLQERCFACHGALKQEAGLRLDTAASAKVGGGSGPAIVPGNSDSLLLARIQSADLNVRMPPEGEPLKKNEINAIRLWIAQGAIAPDDEKPEDDPRDHWAFRSPVRPDIPVVETASWIKSPIDSFMADRHREMGLVAQPAANRRVWLRRVTLDLVGLPPTLDEMNDLLADDSDEAYEKVVDRLLASPQYAERWGRHWMDIWRYSDWWGLGAEVRNSQKHIWHWREWIIESIDDDKPYDQMLREMLAADELYPNDLSRLRASGFLARQYFKFNRTTWLDSTIEHTGKAMLGLTWNCAKCHDHKYDPFSQKEYYQIRAIFEPYQVRTDFVPGISDPEQNGIPRAFDCNPDVPTYIHVRGDERNPDTSQSIQPDVPAFLQFDEYSPAVVSLPVEARQPGLRPFVLETALMQTQSKILAATVQLDQANAALSEAIAEKAGGADSKDPVVTRSESVPLLIDEDFSKERPDRWEVRGGEWTFESGRVRQKQIGSQTRSLRLKLDVPQDFEVTLKYVPHGGEMWKSVGIAFDIAAESQAAVYLSSNSPEPKAQVSFQRNGQSEYPAEAKESRPVDLNQSHTLVVKIRDRLVNVFADGKLSVMYRLPIERRAGPLEIMTFDVDVTLEQFTLRELTSEDVLTDPAGGSSQRPSSIDEAKLIVLAAEKTLEAAQLEPVMFRDKFIAERAHLEKPDDAETRTLIAAAARSERTQKVAELEARKAEADLAVFRASGDQKSKAAERLASEDVALSAAIALLNSPLDSFSPLNGSLKTLESNLETEESRLKPFPASSTGRRTAFANWVTDKRNPLTARVAVNHIWNRHFGRGIVPSVFDFGRKGVRPTHPELLDWLAVEFVDSGWSMKQIHKLIVLSGTYRMTSSSAATEPRNLESDGDNKFYWRRNPVRMEAQVVRDSLLHLAGQLDLSRGGPSIPVNDEASKRRSLYFVHSHNEHHPFLSIFDDAGVLECYRRAESIVPQQALALENSRLATEMAIQIAARLHNSENVADDESFIRQAFLTVLNVAPNDEEMMICLESLRHPESDDRPSGNHQPPAVRVRLIQALLNHNDFVTIR